MNYSETINLPRTNFSMKAGLSENEPRRLEKWQGEDLYQKMLDNRENCERFILHDGPPYANGDIHIGHALNKILKDILVKFKTLQGFYAPYVPGWDCHGLPIEHEVTTEDPELKEEGTEAVRAACEAYSLKYVEHQLEQFNRLGVTGDWDDPYLTLNPEYEAEILRSFLRLVEDNFIYRQLKPIHWCWDCETALAEAEVEYDSIKSPSIYVDFKVIEDPNHVLKSNEANVMIWTTTPWTLPANVAVAVHPEINYVEFRDPSGTVHLLAERLLAPTVSRRDWTTADVDVLGTYEGSELEDLVCAHPLMENRASRVVSSKIVTLEQGTGCVHIAPGHGQEDFELGQEYDLPVVSPVNDRGEFTEEYGPQAGVHVLTAQDRINEELSDKGTLFHEEKIEHSYPFCWRCDKPVIFRATPQWFLDVDHHNLRQDVLESLNNISWYPPRSRKRFQSMVEGRPDWCLSRQRDWGVPIPAVSCQDCGEALLVPELIESLIEVVESEGSDVWFQKSVDRFLPATYQCPECGGDDFTKSEDILDVWFDSGVSHLAVLKNREDLSWPADVYLEGSDQHRGWFQLSMLPSMALEEAPPFREVITNGFVVDEDGKKMSKSRGNVVSPLEVAEEDGADILRLWVASEDYSEDVRLGENLLEQVRTKYRRIRNICKFFLGNLQDFDGFSPEEDLISHSNLHPVDRWFVSELYGLIHRVTRAYEEREFHAAMSEVNNFCANEASALFLDITKDRLYCDGADSASRRSAQTAVYHGVKTITRLIAPVLVFTADEVWEYFNEESVHLSDWPEANSDWEDKDLVADFDRLRRVREEVSRTIEEHPEVGSSDEASVTIFWPKVESLLLEYESILPEWLICADVTVVKGSSRRDIEVEPTDNKKCERCWRYRDHVEARQDVEGDLLCERCYKVLSEQGKVNEG